MEIILKNIYKEIKTIAVLGSSPKEGRPSYKVAKELQKRGYKIIPINPNYDEIMGERAYKSLKEVEEKIDLALYFVASDKVFPLIEDAIEKRVSYIWLQEGVISVDGKELSEENNIDFMMNRCIYKELKKIEEE